MTLRADTPPLFHVVPERVQVEQMAAQLTTIWRLLIGAIILLAVRILFRWAG